jgi:RNA polymerase sigma-70 factor, ECF subfamily
MDANAHPMDIRRELVALLPQIRRFAMTLTRDATKVDDLVVAACEQAIHKAYLWKGEKRLEPQLFALIRSLSRNDLRKRKPGERDAQPEPAGRKETGRHPSLDAMTTDNAVIFLLCAIEGLSYSETATVMGLATDAVANAMVSARRELATAAATAAERRA